MPEQKTIPQSEVDRLLEVEEGHYSDVKRIEIKPSKLSETVSAFANTSGGEIFVGVAEDKQKDGSTVRHWAGFINMEAANGILQVLEGMAALGNHYRATFLNSPGQSGHVLHLTVLKTREILKASDGHPYVRRNAQNLRVDTDDGLRRLRLDKGIATFEDETLNIPPKTITNSKHILEFVLQVVPSAEPEEWLASQFLIANDNPVVAGVLLFADEPQAALPKRSAIKIYRYKTREEEGTRETLAFDPITVEGCLYDQIASAVDGTKRLVEGIKRLGTKGLEDVVYPHETLHEVVTNAVLHRDYSIASDIQIRIYDNRIEVESPGKLPGHVTKANILTEQSARNPKIVRLINKFPNPPNKDVGEGLNTAFAAMEKLRLKAPEIEEAENSVVVRISHTPLASPEETVMEYLTGHDEITNGIGRELTGIRSENSMKEVFLRLKKRKLIEPVPGKKGKSSAWRKYTGAEFSGEDDVDEDDIGEYEDSLVSDKIDRREYYITTAIAYPNGAPHIGHAYEAIATDAIARFMRLDGRDVFFLTGTDEHGQKIQQTAALEGLTPRQLLDRNVPRFEDMVKRLECSNNDFIHTTEERHHRSSEEIWRRMEKKGDIYPGKYAGWYSVRDEAYYAEEETQLNEHKQRVASKTRTPVEWVEEESYFFKLSAYQQKLLDLYTRPNYVLPKERLNEVASFVRGGLQDLSISRTTFD
jgi:ATP-dependent DNA helicase RecG